MSKASMVKRYNLDKPMLIKTRSFKNLLNKKYKVILNEESKSI